MKILVAREFDGDRKITEVREKFGEIVKLDVIVQHFTGNDSDR
jgi:hypothetical protein